jgi:hypothetical protein
MKIDSFSFGRISIDGATYEHDVLIDRGKISKRRKKPSRALRGEFGHTPLSIREEIPWKCKRLVIGTGAYGSLPVMKDIDREAKKRGVKLVVLPTEEAIERLNDAAKTTNAILHVTC